MRKGRVSPSADPSDADLVVRLQAGDANALAVLYDRHAAGIHDFLARFTRDPAAAADLVQATFLRAWERRSTLRTPARVRSWLYAAAHDLARDHLAGSPRRESIGAGGGAAIAYVRQGPVEAPLAREAAELVWEAAASLEARQYAVLDLSLRRGLSTREVADVTGVPVAHAAVLVNRAREALGNAVRWLMVARRRERCLRLAALVPARVRVLTGHERSAVDQHVRGCDVCRDLGSLLESAGDVFGALLPLPLPAALANERRLRLVASARARPGLRGRRADASRWPPRRPPWDGRPRWAVALVVGLLLLGGLGGGAASLLLGPSTPSSAQRRAPTAPAASPGGPVLPVTTPSPSAQPVPSAEPSPATPPPVAFVAPVTPTPTSRWTPPSPAPSPPRFVVRQVTVRWDDPGACQLTRTGAYACHFTVALSLAGANGSDAVMGTLIAATVRGERSMVDLPPTVPAKGATTAAVGVTATFKSNPCGAAAAVIRAPNAVASQSARFGACPIGLLPVDQGAPLDL